ncbi:MAG: PHP domain-containing protein [Betaproteobacteria bacterium]|nr:PHP domain-containing protein [Betaproteobacteria bacterium]
MNAQPHYDLHCHSTVSDGTLTPTAIVERAAARGVDVLALTDHDEIAGLDEARLAAAGAGLRFIDGTELSVSWRDLTLHIVGLGIDPHSAVLVEGMRVIRSGRLGRARLIGKALERVGIVGAFEGAARFAANEQLLSRTHFARFLVEAGHVKDVRDVFKRYLTPGKPGYVEHEWASLADVVNWIHGAGGQAVLAHPGRYKINRQGMRELLAEFRDRGGDAIEVLTSSHTHAQYAEYAGYALHFGFLASCGSDYHGPGESWMDFGDLPPMPPGLTPVWHAWT